MQTPESRRALESWDRVGDGAQQMEFLGQLLDVIPAPVFYKDEKQIYRGCNTAFEAFLGLPRQEIIGKTVFEISPPDLAQRYAEQDRALLDNPPIQVYEAEVQSGSGRRLVVFHKATYMDEGGRLSGIVGMIFDITERRRAEDALRAAAEELRAANERLAMADKVFETTNEGILLARSTGPKDTDFRIVDVNDAYCRLTGWVRDEALGSSLDSLLFGERLTRLDRAAVESLRNTREWKGQVDLARADGTAFPAWLSLSVVRERDDAEVGLVGVFVDLTDIKKAWEASR